MNPEDIRKQFANIKKSIYFDSAATTKKPAVVIEALRRFYTEQYATVHRAIYSDSIEATEKYNQSRQKVASFISASSDQEIVFTRNTTEAINLVALSYGSFIEEDDEIIISEMEHHSNIVPWQMLAKRTKARLRIIPIDDDANLMLEEYEKLLSDKTKIVAITHISNVSGVINPIKEIIKSAHTYGAKVLIDGAQAAAHLRINVKELDADFYTFSAHKAYGPTGVGVLYGKLDLLKKMPPVFGGGDMIESVTLSTSKFQQPPWKFEAGTPAIAEVIGFKRALEYLEELGLENIHSYETKLTEYATKKLSEIEGVKMIGHASEKSSIISFVVEDMHPLDVGTFLDAKKIAIRTGHHCAEPFHNRLNLSASCRISFGIYNTFEEIDTFALELQKITRMFQAI